MDTEQLKLIVDLINGLGTESKDAFITYLAVTVGGQFLSDLIGWIFTFVIFGMIIKAIRAVCSNFQRLDALLKMVKPGCNNDPWSTENEYAFADLCRIVRVGLDKDA